MQKRATIPLRGIARTTWDLQEPPRRAHKGRERGPRSISIRVQDAEALDHIRWQL
jgi:hypothetical protein